MKYTLEKVDIKEKKSGEKNGKKWSFTPVGLRINGKWHNGIINDDSVLETLKEGCEVELILYEEEYNDKMYDKFKLPKESDVLKARVDRLEKAVTKLHNHCFPN